MARKKVALQWIANDATRRATFKKRRKGLMKKASELATLCDVKACVVVYGEGESRPEVWPEAPGEAESVVARFKDVPELDQCKKMLDMEGYMRQQVDKLREHLHKAQRENREREAAILLHDAIAGRRPGLAGLSVEEVAGLGCMVEARIQAVRAAIASLQGEGVQDVPPLPAPSPLPLVPYSAGAGAGGGHSRDMMMMMMMMQVPNQQGWMMAGGRDIGALAYSGAAGSDMPPQFGGGVGFGFAWPDAGQSFPSM
ncbi:unnamed protein product [Urochloa decumbens]|uniref:MADS-box domain-containing protein n=1 Tax=Urochloa decumbens TaxID=240449 RepID=A0ABC9GX19_9POAL